MWTRKNKSYKRYAEYAKNIADKFKVSTGLVKKLIPTFGD